ncbi:hypothetical protein GKZ90_0017800 [Flavobacterium sp. MC2016-06]|jgi:hypothetical protein|uniref:hypothetical protein n=1 Tax=Flavobacterium sp. MC2016-06 TaxID=2676308 RepID=UPI0012BAFA6B|nr:hypothetical protein [Flavobacterium sp. MC2016-06]MBU3860425.1 hypothetical protein [Flavobacterium sp. MC2016-06]
MKTIFKSLVIFFMILIPSLFFGQNTNDGIKIENLEMPNAPALTLLDQTTANIETPKNIQALTTTIMNNVNNNFALEINPYMILNNHKNFYDFYNVKWDAQEKQLKYQGWFTSIIKDLSISFAKVKKDSTNYLSIGARTNLIRIVGNEKKFINEFNRIDRIFENATLYSTSKEDIDDYTLLRDDSDISTATFKKIIETLTEQDLTALNYDFDSDNLNNPQLSIFLTNNNITKEEFNTLIKKRNNKETLWQIIERFRRYKVIKEKNDVEILAYYNEADTFRKNFASNLSLLQDQIPKPLFTLDAAVAYSLFYPNDNYSKGQTGKFGVWSTANLNFKLLSNDNKEYLSFYAYGRYLKDNSYLDINTNTYIKTDYFDIGTKIELEYHKLTFAYEYIHRDKGSDNYRSVGSIKYKFSDTITLTGGFGKNFEQTDNLVSIIGINWGIESNNNFSTNKI